MSLFGKCNAMESIPFPAWNFNQKNLNVEEEMEQIGQPKLMRTIKNNEFPGKSEYATII